MNLSKYLKKLYHTNIQLIKTNKGLTNDIYEAYIDNEHYVIRVPKNDIKDIIGKKERQVLDLIANTDLDVEEVFYDPKTRIRITKWIDALDLDESMDPNKYYKATTVIKKLHQYKFRVNHYFEPFLIYKEFINQINSPLFDYKSYEYLFTDYDKLDEEYILCHNDLVAGNILFSEHKTYLIDYEYASMNHPYFDLMSLISENNIDDENIRKEIYRIYFGHEINNELLQKLNKIEMMQNLLWATWANMLYDSRHEEIYLKIFNDKIKHLLGVKK